MGAVVKEYSMLGIGTFTSGGGPGREDARDIMEHPGVTGRPPRPGVAAEIRIVATLPHRCPTTAGKPMPAVP
ncbi:hypothetical protein HRbin30_02283 [bacterium HR30]|nr:hypothetical protein HRbin30_02283 [bacterium HR30]